MYVTWLMDVMSYVFMGVMSYVCNMAHLMYIAWLVGVLVYITWLMGVMSYVHNMAHGCECT